MGVHRHDRAGTIAHQHIVRDPNWDPLVVHRVDGIGSGKHTGLFLVDSLALDIRLTRGLQLIFIHGGFLVRFVYLSTNGCSGENTMNVTPHNVSGRVVNISIGSPALSSPKGAVLKMTEAPSLRPIQLVCRVLTRSGQSNSSKRNNSSAYCVALKNHCSRFFLTTGVPQRSQTRFSPITCSRANVVLSLGHQSTAAIFR